MVKHLHRAEKRAREIALQDVSCNIVDRRASLQQNLFIVTGNSRFGQAVEIRSFPAKSG